MNKIFIIISFVYLILALLFWYFFIFKDVLKKIGHFTTMLKIAITIFYMVGISVVFFTIIRFVFL